MQSQATAKNGLSATHAHTHKTPNHCHSITNHCHSVGVSVSGSLYQDRHGGNDGYGLRSWSGDDNSTWSSSNLSLSASAWGGGMCSAVSSGNAAPTTCAASTNTVTISGDTETRPINYAYRLWKRTK